MNKNQIKAELRRSACEDKDPAFDVHDLAFSAALDFKHHHELFITSMKIQDCRTLFLLVAEAL